MVKQYCVGCHSDRGKAGQLTLASFDAAKATDHVVLTEKMIRKLRAQMMPPAGARRPEAEQITALADGARNAHRSRGRCVNPNPGSRPFQRLNRAEYARAVKDMLGIDIDVASLLPADTISNGFDNVADAQAFSATLMESYLRAAARVTALAIGDPGRRRDRNQLPRARRPRRSCRASRARRSARAAGCRCRTRSRPTAITSSRSNCTATPAACCSAAPTKARPLKSRWTASARRS